MALMTTNLTAAQRQQVLSYMAETAASKTLTAQKLIELSADQKEALINAGIITGKQARTGATITLTKAELKKIIADDAILTKDKKLILSAFGVTEANLTEASSWEILGKSMVKWLFTTPAGWATLAIGAVAGAIAAYIKWGDTVENATEKLEESKQAYQEVKSELENVNNELKTTQDRIRELEGKDTLTLTEKEELDNLKKQNDELKYQNDLLEEQNRIKNKEKNKDFVHLMDKKSEGSIYTTDENGNRIELTGKDKKKYWDDFNITNYLSAKTRHDEGAIDTYEKQMMERWEEYEDNIEGIEYIPNPTNDDERAVNEWLDFAYDYRDRMMIALGGDGAKESAFNRVVDNWQFDEVTQKLQNLGKEGKVTAEMLNDPKYDAFIQKLIDIEFISDDTEGSLRFVASAFNGTMQSAKNYLSTLDSPEAFSKFINNLDSEAKALGTTKEELATLIGYHLTFDNTSLKTDDKIKMLNLLQTAIGNTSAEMKYLLTLFNVASGNFDTTGMTDDEVRARRAHTKHYLKNKYGFDFNETEIPEKDPYVPSGGGDKDKGKDNTPDYEDPTDAIINRINLRSKEIEQQEEYIQDSIEIAKIMGQEEHLISLTNDKLLLQKQRLDELKTANAGLHNEAEYLRSTNLFYDKDGNLVDTNTWFNSLGEETKEYKDFYNMQTSKEEQERIKDFFENVSKYKKAYMENTEDIANLNKENLQTSIDIVDIYAEKIKSERGNEIKYLDDIIAKEEGLLRIREAQYEAENKIVEAQSEIDKELEKSKSSKEYLSKSEYDKIFNDKDYNKLSKNINKISNEINIDSEKFYKQVEDAYANGQIYLVETITEEYERQLAMKERELEIAKANVDLEKKRLTLENTLSERNIKQYSENGVKWVADQEAVQRATDDFIDAQSEIKQLEKEYNQQMLLDERQAGIDSINNQKSFLEDMNKKTDEAVERFKQSLLSVTEPLVDFENILRNITSVPSSSQHNKSTIGGSSSSSSVSSGGGGGSRSNASFLATQNYAAGIKDALARGDINTALRGNELRNKKIDTLGLDVEKWSEDDIKKGNIFDSGGVASGKGLMLKGVDEEETVLPPWLTKVVLTPEYNENFDKLLSNMQMVGQFNPSDFIIRPQTDSLLMRNVNQPTSISKTWTGNMYVDGGDPNEILRALSNAFDHITI